MPIAIALHKSPDHHFTKVTLDKIHLVAGIGVDGDAHAGEKVQHLSRVARDPGMPNLRQVHLIEVELLKELGEKGFSVLPGELGKNITTMGIALTEMSAGTRLRIVDQTEIEITGLRNPCVQIDHFLQGLLAQVVCKKDDGTIIRKAGIMAIVITGGVINTFDEIRVDLPSEFNALTVV